MMAAEYSMDPRDAMRMPMVTAGHLLRASRRRRGINVDTKHDQDKRAAVANAVETFLGRGE